jgi:selenocysteine lyase/cysteine desulfurase
LVHAFRVDSAARASLAPYSQMIDVEVLLDGLEALVRAKPGPAQRSRLRIES